MKTLPFLPYAQRAGETREIKVYTNLDTVELYLNGKKVGEAEAVDHICKFDVALAEGYNIFLAVANGVKDTMTIEKVEVEPEIYTLPQTDDGNEGAANWFTAMGSVDLEDNAPMEFPEGKMSIKTNIGDIYKNEEAWAMFSELTGGKLGPDMPMWGMMQNFNLEMLMGMMGNAPESALKAMNKKLIAFDYIPE